jgi:PadR family transcriptional regulator PadR
MADKSSDLVQGTLDMLILKTLALEPTHGYGISIRIEQLSKGVFRVNAGSLFVTFPAPAACRTDSGRMESHGKQQARKVLVPTEQGRKRLSSETREWGRQVAAIARILEAS